MGATRSRADPAALQGGEGRDPIQKEFLEWRDAMIVPFVVLYALPLLAEVPWMLTGSYLFFVTLHGLGRVRTFSDTSYSFLPRSVANRLRTRTDEQERRYVWWCLSGAAVALAIAAVRLLFPAAVLAARLANSALLAVVLAAAYAPVYHNKAELIGDWAWPRMRRSRVWTPLQGYFNLTPVYMTEAPPDMPTRDERRQTAKLRRRRRSGGGDDKNVAGRLNYEMTMADTRAFLACKYEPGRFFTLSRRRYERVVRGRRAGPGETSGPQARRPRIYAMHPHGISAVTAIFGAIMHGPDAMLPEADNVRVAVADLLFYVPIVREWSLLCGCISAAPEAISHSMSRGRDLLILPGGMLEQAMADFRKVEIVWNRFGFCRMAYQHSASIVPICAFGENETYMVFNWWPAFRVRNYRRFGYAFPWLFVGPLPANTTPVIGLPIDTARSHSTDASRHRAQRYLDRRRHGNVHPAEAHPADSDGDTPLVDLQRVSESLADGVIDMRRPVSDYYGTGYRRDEDAKLMGDRPHWAIEHYPTLEEDDGYVTLMDSKLDEEHLIESSFVADLQRAFYAQFVDLHDCATFALPRLLPDTAPELWGPSYAELRRRLNRDEQVRRF